MKKMIFITASLVLFSHSYAFKVDPKIEMERLLKEIDSDKDRKITIYDTKVPQTTFVLKTKDKKNLTVDGIYYISNLLQELKLNQEKSDQEVSLKKIFENPVDRIARSIRDRYWSGLTRQIDESSLSQVLIDSKIPSDGNFYLYVPHSDKRALNYYQDLALRKKELNLKVIRLPEVITPEYVESLKLKHGLLSLALRENKRGKLEGVPYVVPGGRFNELYGWDSYFHVLGLVNDGKVELAQNIIDNFVYEIEHYGKILNANRTYYLTRSQPPFLTSMIRIVFDKLPDTRDSKKWLETSLKAAIKEYKTVWMGEERLRDIGLSRYAGFSHGIPPEVEPGHFSDFLRPIAKKYKVSEEKLVTMFNEGKLQDKEMIDFFNHDRAVRESGHDTTYRWRIDGKDKAADYVTVDLNVLLYKYELDFAFLIKKFFKGKLANNSSADFIKHAQERKKRIRTYLWNSKRGLFFDYDWKTQKSSSYLSATTFYPLWAFEPTIPDSKILNHTEAKILLRNALSRLEAPGGITATDKKSLESVKRDHDRQWEYPNGWAPHQMLIWQGLKNYGFEKDANRLIYKWLYLITKNAMNFNGTIPEKYDVMAMSHEVFAEYGNVGTKFSYITKEGFGWMNASYVCGLKQIDPKYIKELKKLVPSEWIKF